MTCSQKGCKLTAVAIGMCRRHYNLNWRKENPSYSRHRQGPCQSCGVPCRASSHCHSCMQARRRRKIRKLEGWKATKLDFSAYYRRKHGKQIVMRVYAGLDYRYEVECDGYLIAKKASDLTNAIRCAQVAASRMEKMRERDAKR